MAMGLMYWFLYFIIYSVAGWVYESILCSITGKKLVNRGFLNGPLCPVYGFGAILIVLVFYGRETGFLPLFLSSMVLTTTVEYVTSVLLETFFHARWWDYSERPFNVHGRVYLTGALVFASMSVVVVNYAHPAIESYLYQQPMILLSYISLIVLFAVLFDLVFTVRHLLLLNKRIALVKEEFDRLLREGEIRLEELKQMLQSRIEDTAIYTEKVRLLLQKGRYQNRRIFNAFPDITPLKNREIFNKLKNTYVNGRKKLDDQISKLRDS
ncbi:hypothetical protein ACHAL6_15130 [Proteiniclasticum sp. C24MP]|uniref:putative ABC transporter permease n=1 Tax=Proteiniclasticum sp. C24MP TaxID=3374101 RepID=UPI003754E04D